MKISYNFCPQCGSALVQREHGGRERPSCPVVTCGFVFWDNPVIVLAAVVEQNGHVVLVQGIGWPSHWYGLVTGFMEREETPEEGILREVKEEIGLDGELQSFLGTYPFYRNNQLILAYHIRVPDQPIRLQTDELADYKCVPVQDVIPWDGGTGLALRDWLRSRGIEREPVPLNRDKFQK